MRRGPEGKQISSKKYYFLAPCLTPFSLTSQVLTTLVAEDKFVRSHLVSDQDLTSDRWVRKHTVTMCVCLCLWKDYVQFCSFLIWTWVFEIIGADIWFLRYILTLDFTFHVLIGASLMKRKYIWTIFTLLFLNNKTLAHNFFNISFCFFFAP